MKIIDKRFRHLPEDEAREATEELRLREAAPEAYRAEMKADDLGPKQAREAFVQKDRRTFMELIAKSGIATGLIKGSALLGGVLANRHALAQEDVNKRVIFCYINSGAPTGSWMPTSASVMNQVTVPYGPTDYNVADICHFRQVNVITSGHQTAMNSLGNLNYSVATMDKRIADVLGTTSVRKQIYLGAQATTGQLCSNSGPCMDSPTQALASIFSNGSSSSSEISRSSSAMSSSSVMSSSSSSSRVVSSSSSRSSKGKGRGRDHGRGKQDTHVSYDTHLRTLDSVKSKLSAEEVVSVQEQAQSLVALQTELAATTSGAPSATCESNLLVDSSNMQQTGRSQADIIVAALACGITKVATLQLGNHDGLWRAHNTAWRQTAHEACHSVPSPSPFIELLRYINDVPAYLIDKLRKTNGPDGQPLIKTTVVVQVTCMGNGMTHAPENAPFIVATEMPGFVPGYSASTGGTVLDLNGAIPKGLGLTGIDLGSSTLGLV